MNLLRQSIMEHPSNFNNSNSIQPRPVTIRRKLSNEEKKNMTSEQIRAWKARERLRRKVTKAWAKRAQDAARVRELRNQEAVVKDGDGLKSKEQRIEEFMAELEVQGDSGTDINFDIDFDNVTE